MNLSKCIKRIKAFFSEVFQHHCPDCNSIMKVDFFHSEMDKNVYKCTKCGRQWT